jgi:hypothetical protein
MTAMSREEILTHYRGLREISKRHQTEAVRFIPHSALLDQARRIGLAIGKTLVAESMDELTLAFDLALFTAPPGRSRGIERYARSAAVPRDRMMRVCSRPCARRASRSGRWSVGTRRPV